MDQVWITLYRNFTQAFLCVLLAICVCLSMGIIYLQGCSTCHGEYNLPIKYLQISAVGDNKCLKYLIKCLLVQYFHGMFFDFVFQFNFPSMRTPSYSASFLRNPWLRLHLQRQHQRAVPMTAACAQPLHLREAGTGQPTLPSYRGGHTASASLEAHQAPAWGTPSFSYKTKGSVLS